MTAPDEEFGEWYEAHGDEIESATNVTELMTISFELAEDEEWFEDACSAAFGLWQTPHPFLSGTISIQGRRCDDLGGFSDVPRMQVILRDVNGDFITQMEPNSVNGIASSGDSCFNVYRSNSPVPKMQKYMIDVGAYGEWFVDRLDFDYLGPEPLIFELSLNS